MKAAIGQVDEITAEAMQTSKSETRLASGMPRMLHQRWLPRRVYRLMDRIEHAKCFAEGTIKLSTLAACRSTPDPFRFDAGEGKVWIRDALPATHENNTGAIARADALVDALILCTTKEWPTSSMVSAFGRYLVEIFEPREFFAAVTARLAKHCFIESALISSVYYVGRTHSTTTAVPHLGLLKPRVGYSHEKEIRMLWSLAQARPMPLVINVPEVQPLVRLHLL